MSSNLIHGLETIPLVLNVVTLWIWGALYFSESVYILIALKAISLIMAIVGIYFAFREKSKLADKILFVSMIGQDIFALIGVLILAIAGDMPTMFLCLIFLIVSIIFSLGIVVSGILVSVDGRGKKIAKNCLFFSYLFVPLTYIVMVAVRENALNLAMAVIATIGVGFSFIACVYFTVTEAPKIAEEISAKELGIVRFA